MRRPLALAAVLALTPGCFAWHGVEPGGIDAAPARDAAPPRPDAFARDTGPLPDEPPPDPGPDARPSDDSGDWRDPPPPFDDRSCCTAVGGVSEVPVGEAASGHIAVAWNGSGWTLLYGGSRTLVAELARDGTRVGDARAISDRRQPVPALVARAHGFGTLLRLRDAPFECVARIDRWGTVVAEGDDLEFGVGRSLAYSEHLDRWLVTSHGRIQALDRDGRSISSVEIEGFPGVTGVLVGLRSRAVLVFQSGGVYASIVDPTLAASPPRLLAAAEAGDMAIGATRLRDEAIAVEPRATGSQLVAIDPFTLEVDARRGVLLPQELAGVLGLDEPGLIASCHAHAPGVEVHVFGRDGLARGAPLNIGAEAWRCALGWSGDTLLVAWSAPADTVVHVRAYSLAR